MGRWITGSMVQRRRRRASVPPLASGRTLLKTWQCWGTRIWESSIFEWKALVVWVQLLRKQVEETVKQNPVDAHGSLALSSSKLQAAKLAVPWYSVCTQSAWNDNEAIHGKSRGEGCGSAQLPPYKCRQGCGGALSPTYNRAKKGLQGRKGGKAREWMREGSKRGSVGCRRVGERKRERTLPCRMIERGGEEAELPQMKWGENNSGINQA